MTTRLRMLAAVGLVSAAVTGLFTAVACSSSSGGASGGDGGSGVTYSCTLPGTLCTQIVAPPSDMAGEQQACAMQMGMFAVAPCSQAGVVGCCINPDGIQEQCVYTATAGLTQSLCTQMGKMWVTPEGGSTGGAGAFVGTWARSGTQTVTCPSGSTTNMISGDLVIALGPMSDTLVATQPDGCMTNYSVSSNIATAMPGQMCSITTEAGVAETITVTSHTLTLSSDGLSLVSMSTDTIVKTATGTMCMGMASGTYTKM